MGAIGLSGRSWRCLAMALALALAACSQPEIDERLRCTLHADGSAEIELEIVFPDAWWESDDDGRRERLEAVERTYLEGWDPWPARFEAVGRNRETFAWERRAGRLHRLVRGARVESPEDLAEFFATTDLTVLFSPDPEESELAIFAAASSRATEGQREHLAAQLAAWSRSAVDYLGQVADLYAYLETRDERAEPIFAAIFEDSYAGLTEGEGERLDRLLEAFVAVLEIADQRDEEGNSLERLAQLVYDPFPAQLSVAIEGELLSNEGFVAGGEGSFAVPSLGLERALGQLEARWIEPPLLTTYERIERLDTAASFDVAEFAARERRAAELPDVEELASAVAAVLEPAEVYRLRWRSPSPLEN